MKKLLFFIFQVFICFGNGSENYELLIKDWDMDKPEAFLDKISNLATSYKSNKEGQREYWKKLFTYLLQREPELYEAVQKLSDSKLADFIKASKDYFDGIVKSAKQNIENVVDQIMKMEATSYTPEGRQKLAEYIKEHNVDIRRVYIKILQGNVELRPGKYGNPSFLKGGGDLSRLSLKTFKFLVDRGYGKYVNADGLIFDLIVALKNNSNADKDIWAKIDYLVEKNQKYNLEITDYDVYHIMPFTGIDSYINFREINFKEMIKIIELCKNPLAVLEYSKFFYQLAGEENLFKYLNENKNKLEITDAIHDKIIDGLLYNKDFKARLIQWIDQNYKQKFGSIEKRTPSRKLELSLENKNKERVNFLDSDMDKQWVVEDTPRVLK